MTDAVIFLEAQLGRWDTESRQKLLDFTAFYLGVIYFGENSVRNYVLGYFEDAFPTFLSLKFTAT